MKLKKKIACLTSCLALLVLVLTLRVRLRTAVCGLIAPNKMEICIGHYTGAVSQAFTLLNRHYCGRSFIEETCDQIVLDRYVPLNSLNYAALVAKKTHGTIVHRNVLHGISAGANSSAILRQFKSLHLLSRGIPEPFNLDAGTAGSGLKFVGLATKCSASLSRFVTSMNQGGRNLSIIGLGETFMGWTYRLWRVYEFTAQLDPNDVFIATDTGDILVLPHCKDDHILQAFASFQTPIVFAAEKACWPVPNMWWHYQQTESHSRLSGDWKFLNAGSFIAYVWAFQEIVDFLQLDACLNDQALWAQLYVTDFGYIPLSYSGAKYRALVTMNPSNHPATASFVQGNRNFFKPSHAAYLRVIKERNLTAYPYISLDVNGIIFQSVWLAAKDEFALVRLNDSIVFHANKEFYRRNKGKKLQHLRTEPLTEANPPNRLINKLSQSCPCVFHHNGDEKYSQPVLANFAKAIGVPFAGNF